MLYRAKVYFKLEADDPVENTVALRSESFKDQYDADLTLEALLKLPNVTGGAVEAKVNRIGWVLVEEKDNATDRARELAWYDV